MKKETCGVAIENNLRVNAFHYVPETKEEEIKETEQTIAFLKAQLAGYEKELQGAVKAQRRNEINLRISTIQRRIKYKKKNLFFQKSA